MSFNHETGAPFTLATLPSGGRTHAASVCSISGIKKRKRTEVAVALDGEGIFIYSLQNPQLVTSYALPPSTTFTGAPYSLYRKGSSKTASQRFTYASVTGSAQNDTPQLVCFHEKSLGAKAETARTAYTPSSTARLLAFDALPVTSGGSSTSATHDVMATFDTGDVICLSADLQIVRWAASLKSTAPRAGAIENVSTATAKAVIRGLLRSREDIAAVLAASADTGSDLLELTQVLCVIGRKTNGPTTLSLVAIQPRSPDLTTAQLSPFKHLVSWDLPKPTNAPKAMKASPHYSIHAANGIIHILADTTLLSYDLSDTVPRLYSELTLGSDANSFLRLSPDIIFTTSRQTCRIFDAKYNTLQMAHSLDPISSIPNAASPAKKRKLAQPATEDRTSSPYHLIAYHADQDLVIAVHESEIVGMHLGSSLSRKRVKTESTLLTEALGKGVAPLSKDTIPKWHERKAKLDRYASKRDISKFEETFAGDLGIELVATESHTKHDNEVNGGPLTNGVGPKIPDEDAMAINFEDDEDAEDNLRSWKTSNDSNNTRKQQSRQYGTYALSKIFRPAKRTLDDRSQSLLEIDFFAPNVFQWLLQTGQLSAASIRHAILEEGPENAQDLSLITDGDIVKALVEFDPELHMLSAILNDSGHLPIGEVVQAIKVLMQSLDEQAKAQDDTKLLTNGTAPSDEEMDVDIASELAAASHEMDHAMLVLDHGLLIRSHTLRPALIRLHSFAPRLITTTLRSMLSRRNLESLINVLHLEMKNEGWSLPYDSAVDSSNETPDDHAVAIIASLLSCTLDAVGAGAWLASAGSPAGSDPSEDTIYSLHNDTSEALLGFFEARYMRGLLGEFLRYASNIPRSSKPSNKQLEKKGKPFAISKELSELPMLPLGGKLDTIERTKPGKGGKKEERSKREIGMLISKQVPRYSVEKIVL
ncbi:hypothetical protein CC86DRAFT_352185 [Ophiobolus disseminans]|uniref:Utp8 beta-propeller domain-containing protein n=1 Tax=Ophiobolus disseminans TaxID=1469910 RepID=A0A6A6ZZR0_9PLEO|nr:hypothetical protein CC86DRAFT_352185 [Ophiobolus disseminans]